MNSKEKDFLQYASVFLLAVALTFLMGKGVIICGWCHGGDLIPSLFCIVHSR